MISNNEKESNKVKERIMKKIDLEARVWQERLKVKERERENERTDQE